jgi:Na+-transporting NADH:ubiquinone oxidoreductase subunit NqrB
MSWHGQKPIKDYIPAFLHTAAGAFIFVLLFVDRRPFSGSTFFLAAYVGGAAGLLVYLLRTKEPTETFPPSAIFGVLLMTLPLLPAWGLGGFTALLCK